MGVFITLGNNADVGVNDQRHLVVNQYAQSWDAKPSATVDLGLATEERIDSVVKYLKRLKIHAVKD